jgi:hypothetical protein
MIHRFFILIILKSAAKVATLNVTKQNILPVFRPK